MTSHQGEKITPFLMVAGRAEEAMNFYVTLFDLSSVESITRYGVNQGGQEGTVLHAVVSLGGRRFMCMDSALRHDFTFTPAISLYVACASDEEIDRYFEKLSQEG